MTTHVTRDTGVVEILDVSAFTAQYPDRACAVATCLACGRSWDDDHTSSWTPVPSARCPFEYEHPGLG